MANTPTPRDDSTRNAFWAKGYELYAESIGDLLRPRNPLPAKIDVSDMLISATQSFALTCEKKGYAIEDIGGLGGLFYTIAVRKLMGNIKFWNALKRAASHEQPLGASMPADDNLTPEEEAFVAEALEHRATLVEELKEILRRNFAADPETASDAIAILDLYIEGYSQAQIGRRLNRAMLVPRVIDHCTQWVQETWKEEIEAYKKAVERANETRRMRLDQQRTLSGSSAD